MSFGRGGAAAVVSTFEFETELPDELLTAKVVVTTVDCTFPREATAVYVLLVGLSNLSVGKLLAILRLGTLDLDRTI